MTLAFALNLLLITAVVTMKNIQDGNELVLTIINKIFRIDESLVILYEERAKPYLPRKLHNAYIIRNINKDMLTTNTKMEYNYNYLLFLKCSTLLHFTDILKSSTMWNNLVSMRGKYLLFVLNECNKTEIFSMLWQNYIINAVIVERNNNLTWKMYVYEPFSEESRCGKIIIPKPLAANETIYSFPKYHTFLKHCDVAAWLIDKELPELYFILKNNDVGPLMRPLIYLRELYQANISYDSMEMYVQNNLFNKTKHLLLKALYEKQYDYIIASAYRYSETIAGLELSKIVFNDESIWYVPAPQKTPQIKLLLYIFSLELWLVIVITTLIAITFWFGFCKIKRIKNHNILGLFGIMVGVATSSPKLHILRFYLIFYFVFSQHVAYFFQCELSSKLTIPQYEKSINTIEDMMDSEITIIAAPIRRYFYNESLNPLGKRMYYRSIDQIGLFKSKMNLLLDNHTIAHHGFRNVMQYTDAYKPFIRVISDPIASIVETSYVALAGNPITLTLNVVISRLVESGLLEMWFASTKNNTFIKGDTSDDKIVITLDHLQGAFVLYFIGITLALAIFVFENVYSKWC